MQKEWEEFLATVPEGSFYHSLKWKEILEKSFSRPTSYLAIRDKQGRLIGVMPTVISKLGLLKMYDSLPYSDLGGPVIEKTHVREASLSIQRFLEKSGHEKGISGVKICLTKDRFGSLFGLDKYFVDRGKGVMEIDLERKPSTVIWTRELSKRHRNRIRHFEKDNFQIREAQTRSDLQQFLVVYYENMKNIRASSYPTLFFENIWRFLYPENFSILLCEKEETVGGLAFFKYGQKIYLTYTGFHRELLSSRHSIIPYLLWQSIKWAEEKGFRHICFGGTPADPRSSNYSQKAMFGASFLQQEIASIPFDLRAKSFLLAVDKLRLFSRALPLRLKKEARVRLGI